MNDPGGREKLLALGVRSITSVVAKGDQFVFGQNLDDLARFVGLKHSGDQSLPPEQLIQKWVNVLRAAQRYMRQIPDARLNDRVIDNRDRSIRRQCHHIFRIGAAFAETVVDGVEWDQQLPNIPPADGAFMTADEFVRYGDSVIARLEQWWDGLADKSCQQKVKTFFGIQTVYMLFARQTWHTAQHVRQLIAVLERFDIEPNGRLSAEDLAGLTLPERLWE